MNRGAGILLHITSLPGRYGIGTFGESAYTFAEFLARAGQRYWQILPLGPTGYGDSPYQSFSSHAISPYLIDLDILQEEGLLEHQEIADADFDTHGGIPDYRLLFKEKYRLLKMAFERAHRQQAHLIDEFCEDNSSWIGDYALYMALKSHFEESEWTRWPEPVRRREHDAVCHYRELLSQDISLWKFIQFVAYRQWRRLKEFANQRNIRIIGDIPIYVAYDSADTWANATSGIFKFDEDLLPTGIAGCPPDDFTPDGQYWGTPVYDWQKNKETGYRWWIDRLRTSLLLYDVVRIDHFRGFESYWEIPYGSHSAAMGRWEPGPGMDFVRALKDALGDVDVIAEDLGLLTHEVFEFKHESGFPGMKVLQFAFDGYSGNTYLPHNYERNCVVYTGTHDNNTTPGWFETSDDNTVNMAIRYFNLTSEEGYHWGMIRGAFSSVADVAIIPMQDILGLSYHARMNMPSTVGGSNWKWAMRREDLTDELADKLRLMTVRYAR